jgi:hypothetical protein
LFFCEERIDSVGKSWDSAGCEQGLKQYKTEENKRKNRQLGAVFSLGIQ